MAEVFARFAAGRFYDACTPGNDRAATFWHVVLSFAVWLKANQEADRG